MAEKESTPAFFRNVPGRFAPIAPQGQYGMSQSNYPLAVANQEYAIRGVVTMSAAIIKPRGGAIQLSIYEGQSNTVFTLLADGQPFELSTIPGGQIGAPLNIYVRSAVAGVVVELFGLSLI